ncbi:SDR family NAD(P)-dependent oxidoreductase [Enterococcus olivae]
MKNIVVTGGNRGLGLAIAKALSDPTTHLIIACRDTAHGKQMAQKLPGSSEVFFLDLCSEQSIDDFATQLKCQYTHIDALMNNAGIFDNSGQTVSFMGKRLNKVWVTNTLAPYLLTKKLTPLLQNAQHPKCVFMSSVVGHHKHLQLETISGQPAKKVYAQSKYADLLLTQLFAKEQPDWQVLAVHPGYSNTAIFNGRVADWKKHFIRQVTDKLAQSAEQGAASAILALKESFPSGSYIGPRYLKELYGPPQVRSLQNYYHSDDLRIFEQYLKKFQI